MAQTYRAVLSGGIASNSERWSIGAWFEDPNQIAPPLPADVQGWANAIAAVIPTAVGGTLRNALTTSGTIDTVNTYWYPSLDGPAGLAGAANLTFAGLGTAIHPLPTSMVASLKTGRAGRRYRGRNYWPAIGLTVDASGKFTSTDTTAVPQRFKDLYNAIEEMWPATGALRLVVASKAANEVTPVTSISIGNVPDTQRRRRDGLIEAYTSVAY